MDGRHRNERLKALDSAAALLGPCHDKPGSAWSASSFPLIDAQQPSIIAVHRDAPGDGMLRATEPKGVMYAPAEARGRQRRRILLQTGKVTLALLRQGGDQKNRQGQGYEQPLDASRKWRQRVAADPASPHSHNPATAGQSMHPQMTESLCGGQHAPRLHGSLRPQLQKQKRKRKPTPRDDPRKWHCKGAKVPIGKLPSLMPSSKSKIGSFDVIHVDEVVRSIGVSGTGNVAAGTTLSSVVTTTPSHLPVPAAMTLAEDACLSKLLADEWLRSYIHERSAFVSTAVFCEVKFRELMEMTGGPEAGQPSGLRTAVCLDLYRILTQSVQSTRLQHLLSVLGDEIERLIYIGRNRYGIRIAGADVAEPSRREVMLFRTQSAEPLSTALYLPPIDQHASIDPSDAKVDMYDTPFLNVLRPTYFQCLRKLRDRYSLEHSHAMSTMEPSRTLRLREAQLRVVVSMIDKWKRVYMRAVFWLWRVKTSRWGDMHARIRALHMLGAVVQRIGVRHEQRVFLRLRFHVLKVSLARERKERLELSQKVQTLTNALAETNDKLSKVQNTAPVKGRLTQLQVQVKVLRYKLEELHGDLSGVRSHESDCKDLVESLKLPVQDLVHLLAPDGLRDGKASSRSFHFPEFRSLSKLSPQRRLAGYELGRKASAAIAWRRQREILLLWVGKQFEMATDIVISQKTRGNTTPSASAIMGRQRRRTSIDTIKTHDNQHGSVVLSNVVVDFTTACKDLTDLLQPTHRSRFIAALERVGAAADEDANDRMTDHGAPFGASDVPNCKMESKRTVRDAALDLLRSVQDDDSIETLMAILSCLMNCDSEIGASLRVGESDVWDLEELISVKKWQEMDRELSNPLVFEDRVSPAAGESGKTGFDAGGRVIGDDQGVAKDSAGNHHAGSFPDNEHEGKVTENSEILQGKEDKNANLATAATPLVSAIFSSVEMAAEAASVCSRGLEASYTAFKRAVDEMEKTQSVCQQFVSSSIGTLQEKASGMASHELQAFLSDFDHGEDEVLNIGTHELWDTMAPAISPSKWELKDVSTTLQHASRRLQRVFYRYCKLHPADNKLMTLDAFTSFLTDCKLPTNGRSGGSGNDDLAAFVFLNLAKNKSGATRQLRKLSDQHSRSFSAQMSDFQFPFPSPQETSHGHVNVEPLVVEEDDDVDKNEAMGDVSVSASSVHDGTSHDQGDTSDTVEKSEEKQQRPRHTRKQSGSSKAHFTTDGAGLTFIEFGYALIRLAALVFPRLGGKGIDRKLRELIHKHALVHAKQSTRNARFLHQLASDEIQAALKTHKDMLLRVFMVYASHGVGGGSGHGGRRRSKKTLQPEHLIRFAKDFGFLHSHFSEEDAKKMFADAASSGAAETHAVDRNVNSHGSVSPHGLTFREFLETLVAMACFYVRNPYVSLEGKVDRFLAAVVRTAERRARTLFRGERALETGDWASL